VTLERAGNFVVLLAALLVVGLYASRIVGRWEIQPSRTYSVGDTFPDLPGHSFGRWERSIVAFLHSQCHYCGESMPLLEMLAARYAGGGVPVLAVSREAEGPFRQYLSQHSPQSSDIISIGSDPRFKLSLTPTLVLVDRSGRVLYSKSGTVDDTQRAILLAQLDRQ